MDHHLLSNTCTASSLGLAFSSPGPAFRRSQCTKVRLNWVYTLKGMALSSLSQRDCNLKLHTLARNWSTKNLGTRRELFLTSARAAMD